MDIFDLAERDPCAERFLLGTESDVGLAVLCYGRKQTAPSFSAQDPTNWFIGPPFLKYASR